MYTQCIVYNYWWHCNPVFGINKSSKYKNTPIYCHRGLNSAISRKIWVFVLFIRRMNKMVARGRGLSPFYPPTPCLPPPALSRARFAHAKFSSFSLRPFFPIALPSPSSPLFTLPVPRLPLSSPHFPPPSYPVHLLMNKLPKGYCTKSLQLNKN